MNLYEQIFAILRLGVNKGSEARALSEVILKTRVRAANEIALRRLRYVEGDVYHELERGCQESLNEEQYNTLVKLIESQIRLTQEKLSQS